MNPHVVFVVLIALGVVWTACWAAVLVKSRRAVPFEVVEGLEKRTRLVLLAIYTAISIGLLILTLRWLPYRAARVAELGAPRVRVAVTGGQWAWMLSSRQVPAGVPIEFAVAALDVNHDFAIYDPHGRLLAQVQAMPGYSNHLVYLFHAPGVYTVRCLEYCGLDHHMMTASLTVTGR
jgi:cytochrome c oxidase subunit II